MKFGKLLTDAELRPNVWLDCFVSLREKGKNLFLNFFKVLPMTALSKLFEILYLNGCLLKIETKCLVLRFKLYLCGRAFRKLLLQRGVLVVRQRNLLLEYDSRAMLVD